MTKINFQNLPDTSTPVNATNLNAIQTNVENAIGDLFTIVTTTAGTALKFDNGLVIQYGTIDKTEFLQTTSGSTTSQGITWYRSAAPTITFPVQFIDTTYGMSLTIFSDYSGARVYMPRLNSRGAASFAPQITSVSDFTSSAEGYTKLIALKWIAIGMWK